ncbi:phosphotransferase [Phenylobacterium sp. 20VBR1]|uniref:Phosphotransferase n=1 Tax=Phenylobacterium glaciei TaxID=2803784 RepID=A0A941HY44_9CAUL|nr:phosphotransferase [Phenylobacterium glaciei]MBR7620987.1 phosphotransferase [Phenylobacterium glaciei]
MQPSLGAKIGEGATAEVYAWAPGRVLKLFRAGTPHHISLHEARMTRAVFAAGGLAPEVFEEVMVEGRAGLVMARLEGPTLMQVTKSKAVSYAQAGVLLAEGLHAVHQAPPPPDVPVLRDYMAGSLRRARGTLSTPVAAGVLALIDRLSPRDGLCHGDPNPGNMILTTEGPRLIDWIAAMRAPAALDLASAHVMLTELAPHMADDPERPRAVNAALQAAYAGLSGTSPAALAASVEPYLPVVRALVLLGGAVPAQDARLRQRLAADFPA